MSPFPQPVKNETDSNAVLRRNRKTDQFSRLFKQHRAVLRADFWYKSHGDFIEIIMRFLRNRATNRYKSPDDLYQKSFAPLGKRQKISPGSQNLFLEHPKNLTEISGKKS